MSNGSGFSFSSSSASASSWLSPKSGSESKGVSEGVAIICAIAAPILYAINGILDKTVIAVRVRSEYSYIAMVGCMDITIGYLNNINHQ